MDSKAKRWMAEYGIACMRCGWSSDKERYLELGHHIPRSEVGQSTALCFADERLHQESR